MKNRIARFFPKTEATVECPYCHEARVCVPYGQKDPTVCPVCDARFMAEACADGTPGCAGHITAEPSPELIKMIQEWKEAHRARLLDQREHPQDWLPCWRDDCKDGMEVRLTRMGVVPVGVCDECAGTGKILRV